MQLARMIETGVSTAGAVFALDGANVEGWGLRRADRAAFHAARGPADLAAAPAGARRPGRIPELQMGRTSEQVKALLMNDVLLSGDGDAGGGALHVPRAGQATSYFYGFTRLNELRSEVERRIGGSLKPRRSTTSCCRRARCRRRSCATRCWMVSAGRPRRERRPTHGARGGQILMKMPFLYIQ